jgi:hypothetical protein
LLFLIALMAASLATRSQQVSYVEFGPCFRTGCRLTPFMMADLALEVTDSTVRANDARCSTFRMLGRFLSTRQGCLARDSYICVDADSRPCVVTLVVDGCCADNRVVVSYPGTLSIYHLRIFIVMP